MSPADTLVTLLTLCLQILTSLNAYKTNQSVNGQWADLTGRVATLEAQASLKVRSPSLPKTNALEMAVEILSRWMGK